MTLAPLLPDPLEGFVTGEVDRMQVSAEEITAERPG